ncbi:hypothetical protein BDM02DRAFT_3188750 [Thelephora ganbajun]|uniref:Uncharacterized protein n=1 Tax=Thelephora ganbajun TaxID=370292 RepID=A0ACB6ZA84_THEGA|nr:hypothetical protein BDM02DRAFT_3188750 [Thelephora ganbajun]
MSAAGVALMPGAFLVNALPILKYVSEWFPGAGSKEIAGIAKNLDHFVNFLFQHVQKSFEVRELYFRDSAKTELAKRRFGVWVEQCFSGKLCRHRPRSVRVILLG